MKQALLALILGIALIAGYAKAADPDEHLSTTTYTTGGAFVRMTGMTEGSVEFDVIPKDGNLAWTSIRSCLGLLPGSHTYLRTDLVNLDTGETYYWQRNGENEACTKETFDIPIHTFHRLHLRMTCFVNAPKGKTEYCRGWVTLFSSVHDPLP